MRWEWRTPFNVMGFTRAAALFMVSLFTIAGLGCGLSQRGTDPRDLRVELAQPVRTKALLICLLGDKSTSMKTARSTPIQESDLLEIIALLRTGGGAVALGFVGESSRLPLVRLKVEAPPQKPVQPDDKNPFIRAEKNTSYVELMKHYDSDYLAWSEEVNRRVEKFLPVARQRLADPELDRTSPVFEALDRVELFMSESGGWPPDTRRIVILQSDCKDSTRRQPPASVPDLIVVVVNGTGSLGSLSGLEPKPRQFEALSAALDFVKGEIRN
jgi:hypothetical protein